MARFEMQAETPHGILFLADSGLDVTIPEGDPRSLPFASADCLCFQVLAYVDGASRVTVSDEERNNPTDGEVLYCGALQAKSGVLSLLDSSSFKYLNIPVPVGQVTVEVSADDRRYPSWVWLRLGAIRAI